MAVKAACTPQPSGHPPRLTPELQKWWVAGSRNNILSVAVYPSLVPRPPLTAFFTAVEKKTHFFSTAVKKAARGSLDTRLGYTATLRMCFLCEPTQSNSRLIQVSK